MTRIAGVRFRNGGKVYYFDPNGLELRGGTRVIVETSRGVECGYVVLGIREGDDSKVTQPLRPVLRIATVQDIQKEEANREKEKEAYKICRKKIAERGLEMKLIQAEYTFDGKKLLFYFTADGRVDFRELVKDLASVFRMRIELRQIGVRDETRLLGGIGVCGRPLCCASYLSEFAPVSIRMAKEQNLSLNPTKISGVCGRLMCCLKNEQETYEYLNKKLPGIGDLVQTAEGTQGEVQSVNVLRQTVRVLVESGDDKEIEEYPVSEIDIRQKKRKGGKGKDTREKDARDKEPKEKESREKEPKEKEPGGKDSRSREKESRDKSHREGKSGKEHTRRQERRPEDSQPELKGETADVQLGDPERGTSG